MSNNKILFKADKSIKAQEVEFLMMHLESRKASGGGPIIAFKQLIREDKAVRKQHLLVQYESSDTVIEMMRRRFVCYKNYLLRVMPFVAYSNVCKREHALRMNDCYDVDSTRMLVRCLDHQIEELALLLSKSPGVSVNSLAKSRLDADMYHVAFSAPFLLEAQSTNIQFFRSFKTNTYVISGPSDLSRKDMKKKLQIICEVFVKENPSIESCWVDNWGSYLIVEFDRPVERFENEFLDQDFYAEYLHNYELLSIQDEVKMSTDDDSSLENPKSVEIETQTDELFTETSRASLMTTEAQTEYNRVSESHSTQTEIQTESRGIQTDEQIETKTTEISSKDSQDRADSLKDSNLKSNSTELAENLLALASLVNTSTEPSNQSLLPEPVSKSIPDDSSIAVPPAKPSTINPSQTFEQDKDERLAGPSKPSPAKNQPKKKQNTNKPQPSQPEPSNSSSDTIFLVASMTSINSDSTTEQETTNSEKVKPFIPRAVAQLQKAGAKSITPPASHEPKANTTNNDSSSINISKPNLTSSNSKTKLSGHAIDSKENNKQVKNVKATPNKANKQANNNNSKSVENIPKLMETSPSFSSSSLASSQSTTSKLSSGQQTPSSSPSVTILFQIDPNMEKKAASGSTPVKVENPPDKCSSQTKVIFDGSSKSLIKTVSCKLCQDEKDAKPSTTEKKPPVSRKVHDPLRVCVGIEKESMLDKCLHEIGQFLVTFMQLLNKRKWSLELEGGKYCIIKTVSSPKDSGRIKSMICNLVHDYNTKFLVHESLDVNNLFRFDSRPEHKMVQFEANVNMKFSYINKLKFEFLTDTTTNHRRLYAMGNIRDVRKFLGTIKNSVPRILAPHDNFDYLFPECVNPLSFDDSDMMPNFMLPSIASSSTGYKRTYRELDNDLDDYYSNSKRSSHR